MKTHILEFSIILKLSSLKIFLTPWEDKTTLFFWLPVHKSFMCPVKYYGTNCLQVHQSLQRFNSLYLICESGVFFFLCILMSNRRLINVCPALIVADHWLSLGQWCSNLLNVRIAQEWKILNYWNPKVNQISDSKILRKETRRLPFL